MWLPCQPVNDDILWWSAAQWQAVGTIALVLITIGYVIYTAILSSHASSSAQSAKESAAATERGVLLQVMPLVFGYEVRNTGGGKTEVVLFAIGDSPAFNVVVEVLQGANRGRAGPMALFDPGMLPQNVDLSSGFDFMPLLQYVVEVSYYDALGNGYRTRRTSFITGQSETHVDRFEEDRSEWVQLV